MSTWSTVSKNSSTWSTSSKTVGAGTDALLLEDGFYMLTEDSFHLILEQAVAGAVSWSAQNKS